MLEEPRNRFSNSLVPDARDVIKKGKGDKNVGVEEA
jgi:hypothetical protein